jgi:hypothetical protein
MNKIRLLVYRFVELPHVIQLDIARSLNLIEDGDEQLCGKELWHRVIAGVNDKGLLAKFREKVREQYSDERV